MSEQVKNALGLFDSGFSCAQSVAAAFCEKYAMDEELMLKLACGFAGGLRQGEVCGAVSGAVMVIGLKYGQCLADDSQSKMKCYAITSKFVEEFKNREKTVLCRELLGYDIRDAEARFRFPGKQRQVCPHLIETAVSLLEEMEI